MMPEEKIETTEDEIKLSGNILSKLKVINDTPEIPFEPEGNIVVPQEEPIVPGTDVSQEYIEIEELIDEGVAPEDDILTWDEIEVIRNKAKQFQYNLKTLLNDIPSDVEVCNAVEEYCVKEYNFILMQMPIDKLGIRVNALRSAGYTSIYSVRNFSYSQFLQIRGIGEKSVDQLVYMLGQLKRSAINQIQVRPTRDHGADIVTSYYQYNELSKFHHQMLSELGEINKEFLNLNNRLSLSGEKFSWIFASKKKKRSISDSAKEMELFLSEDLLDIINSYLLRRERIYGASLETCFAAYNRQKSLYNAAFDSYRSVPVSSSSSYSSLSYYKTSNSYSVPKAKKKEKSGGSGCLIWVIIAIVILILLLK